MSGSRCRGVSKFRPCGGISAASSLIAMLNRLMGCQSQCIAKMAALQQERGKLHLGNQRLLGVGNMSFVFVVNQQRKPLDPVHPGRARFLLKSGYAAVLRRYPFTI